MTVPRVSVIVPHYNDPERLGLCLKALEAQSLPRADFEVIVADNGSPQGEEALARLIAGRARLVVVAERGAGPARNGGVAAARGAILAFTDCDCLPDPRWLESGVAALDHCDLAGGRMDILIGHDGALNAAEAFEAVFAFDNERYVRAEGFGVTANLFCRREVFAETGPFRTGLSEDKDWCHRARAAGHAIAYAPDALVAHPPRRNWPEIRAKFARINRETFLYYRATRRAARLQWLLRALALPLSIGPHALRLMATPRLASPAERMGALAMLVRLRLWRFLDAGRLLLTDGGK